MEFKRLSLSVRKVTNIHKFKHISYDDQAKNELQISISKNCIRIVHKTTYYIGNNQHGVLYKLIEILFLLDCFRFAPIVCVCVCVCGGGGSKRIGFCKEKSSGGLNFAQS